MLHVPGVSSCFTRRSVGRVLAALVGISTLGGCGFGSGSGRHTQEIGKIARHEAVFQLGFRNDWEGVPYLAEGDTIEHIQAYDDIVLLVTSAARLIALDANTGISRWSIELTEGLTEFVGIGRSGDLAIAASRTEVFVVKISQGSLIGRQTLNRIAASAPVIMGDTAVFGTSSGELLAHKFDVGFQAWGNKVGTNITTSPAILGDTIAAVADDANVLFVNTSTGRRIGQVQVFGPPGSAPIAGDEYFYLASQDQSFYAFNPKGGDVVWRERTSEPLDGVPVYHDGVVYVELENQGMVAFDGATGERLWTAQGVTGTAVALGDRGLVIWDPRGVTQGETGGGDDGSEWGEAVLLDPQRGDVISRVEVPNIATLFSDTFADGVLFTITDDGRVGRYQPRF